MSRDTAAIRSLDASVQNLLTELQKFESGPHAEGHSGGPPGGGGGVQIEGHSGGPPGGGGGVQIEGHSGGPPGDELHAAITALKNFQNWLRREIDKA